MIIINDHDLAHLDATNEMISSARAMAAQTREMIDRARADLHATRAQVVAARECVAASRSSGLVGVRGITQECLDNFHRVLEGLS